MLLNVLKKKKVTLKVIQTLVRSFNFFTKAIPSVMTFNRRFHNATCGVNPLHYVLRINAGIRENMWLFLGTSIGNVISRIVAGIIVMFCRF